MEPLNNHSIYAPGFHVSPYSVSLSPQIKSLVPLIREILLAFLEWIREKFSKQPRPLHTKKIEGYFEELPEGKSNPEATKTFPTYSQELVGGSINKERLFSQLMKDFLRMGIPSINGISSELYFSLDKIPAKKVKPKLVKKLREFNLSETEIKNVIAIINNTINSQKQSPSIQALLALIDALEKQSNSDKEFVLKGLCHLYQAAFGQTSLFLQDSHLAWELEFTQRTQHLPSNRVFSYDLIIEKEALMVDIRSSYELTDEYQKTRVHIDTKVDLTTGSADISCYRDPIIQTNS